MPRVTRHSRQQRRARHGGLELAKQEASRANRHIGTLRRQTKHSPDLSGGRFRLEPIIVARVRASRLRPPCPTSLQMVSCQSVKRCATRITGVPSRNRSRLLPAVTAQPSRPPLGKDGRKEKMPSDATRCCLPASAAGGGWAIGRRADADTSPAIHLIVSTTSPGSTCHREGVKRPSPNRQLELEHSRSNASA
jgi:hypothetical protein